MMRALRLLAVAVAVIALTIVSGCSSVPADPHGTLDRVRGGVLRVGATHHPPWVEAAGISPPGGDEVDIVTAFANDNDADLEWEVGSEQSLVEALERGDLDLVIGGFTDATPWTERAATTVPYTEATGPDGSVEKHVMLTRMGENRFLVALETFLMDRGRAG